MRYFLWGPVEKGVVVALHGYQDHALSLLRRLGWWERELPFAVLAVNAPFPVPIWTAEGFKEAYSWYFRDTERGFTIVSPQDSAAQVFELLKELNLIRVPTVLFGFSQGGYLAPFLARHLTALRGIIGLGSGYPPGPYQGLAPTAVYALHGERDERIPFEGAKKAHADVLASGFTGEFISLGALTHKVDPAAEPHVRRIVAELLR